MTQGKELVVLLLLASQSAQDIRKRQITPGVVLLCAAAGFCLGLLQGRQEIGACFLGLLPGAGLLALFWLTHGQVGSGDGLLLLAVGVWLGAWRALLLLVFALSLCALVCGGLLAGGIAGRKDEVPFVPFLLAAFMFWKLSAAIGL